MEVSKRTERAHSRQQPSFSMEFHCPEGMSHFAPTFPEALQLGLIRKIIKSLQGHFQAPWKSLLIETKGQLSDCISPGTGLGLFVHTRMFKYQLFEGGSLPMALAWGMQTPGVTVASPSSLREGFPLLRSKEGPELGGFWCLCCTSAHKATAAFSVPAATPTKPDCLLMHTLQQRMETHLVLHHPSAPISSAGEQQTHTYPRYQQHYPPPRGCHGSPAPLGRPSG